MYINPSPTRPNTVNICKPLSPPSNSQLPRAFRSTGTAPVSPPSPPELGRPSYLGSTKVGAPRTCLPRSATGCAPKGRSHVGHFLYP